MICPNCGRRNPAGATFCSRCRQRLPLAARYGGTGYRRAAIAEPTGGGGGGVLVLGVALLAGFLFIGGGAAIYLSTPPQPNNPGNLISDASGSPGSSLPIFVQETPTPEPTPEPTPTEIVFSFAPDSPTPDLFTPIPTFGFATPTPAATQQSGPTPTPTRPGGPTPTPTDGPSQPPTPTPTPRRPERRLRMVSQAATRSRSQTRAAEPVLHFLWDFGVGGHGNSKPNPKAHLSTVGHGTDLHRHPDGHGLSGRSDTRTKTVIIPAFVATPPPTPGNTPPMRRPYHRRRHRAFDLRRARAAPERGGRKPILDPLTARRGGPVL